MRCLCPKRSLSGVVVHIARVSFASLREHVAYVPQDAGLMRGTLAHNITYGCKTHREPSGAEAGESVRDSDVMNAADEARVIHAVVR